jgi:polo-like kinase 1
LKCAFLFPENGHLSFHTRQFITGILQIDLHKSPSARDLSDHSFIEHRLPPLLQELRNTIHMKQMILTSIPDSFVSRFCDYSEKHGFGYLLVNGTVGSCFNVSSRMAMDLHEHFIQYWKFYGVQRRDVIRKDTQKKKIAILLRFAESLKKTVSMFHLPAVQFDPEIPLIHVNR